MTRKRTTKRCKSKGGRPNRAQASAKALKGVDTSMIDPDTVLREIAADSSAPASARVQACRLLKRAPADLTDPPGGDDALSRRALELMRGRRPN